jgi:O-antigen ligase
MATTVRKDMPALFWTIVALVVLLPLPLGAVYQWSWGLMSSVVGLVLAIWSARVGFGLQDPGFGLRSVWPLAILFGIVIAWIGLQAQPFTPASWHHPLWNTAAEALGDDTSSAISLNPFDTLSGLVRLLAYAGIFWISLQYCRRAARARQVLLAVVYGGLAYALYGLAVHVTGPESILIFRKDVYVNDVTSTFVNRNSFATYAGLALVCCTGLFLVLLTHATRSASSAKERAVRFIEIGFGRGWRLLLAWLMLLLALALSHSRAGFFSTLLGLFSLVLVAGLTRAVDRRLALATGALCIGGLIWVLGVGGDQLLAPLLQTSHAGEERPLVYDRTLDAIRDSGALGTGFGTFEEAFRFYRTSNIRGNFDTAHNTYLENVLELGIPAASALFGVFAFFLILCAVGMRQRRRDAVYPCVGFAATILVAAHAFIEFSLQIPAITATYMLIMGAACAQCWSSRRPVDPW